jgi:hypothetical protein
VGGPQISSANRQSANLRTFKTSANVAICGLWICDLRTIYFFGYLRICDLRTQLFFERLLQLYKKIPCPTTEGVGIKKIFFAAKIEYQVTKLVIAFYILPGHVSDPDPELYCIAKPDSGSCFFIFILNFLSVLHQKRGEKMSLRKKSIRVDRNRRRKNPFFVSFHCC